jgi:large conductance mechanosensitive channel
MRSVLREFREFAVRGNVVDMAIGIVIGAAFTSIVNSLVRDVLMPPVGALMGDMDFSDLFIILRDSSGGAPYATLKAAQDAGAITINMGMFVNALISFVIVAFALFMVVKAINKLKRKAEETPKAEPKPTREQELLAEIRDLLKTK